jgi:hypothetical protein
MGRIILCMFVTGSTLFAQQDVFQRVCTNATLEGDFGFTITGMRPSAPGGPAEMIVGVAVTNFDGNGNLTQVDNIHGSITGFPNPDRRGRGTYTINPDCSGTMRLINDGAPPLTLRIVIVDNGNEIRTAVVDPTASVTPGVAAPQVMVTSNGRRIQTRSRRSSRASQTPESGVQAP